MRIGWKTVFVALALAAGLVPVPAASAPGDRCDAITVAERPRLGDRTKGFDWQPYIRVHNKYLRRHPEVFASGYLAGKHMYVGFTRRICHHLRRMRGMVEQRWRFRAFVATYTYAELLRAKDCVGDIAHRDRLAISAWGPDVTRNKLGVMLRKRTERRERIIRRECPRVTIRFTEGEVHPA